MENKLSDTLLINEVKKLIEQSKQELSVTVNATITILYWNIGKKINNEILSDQRAEYGKQIVNTLSAQLKSEYGTGWSEKHLRHCLRFAQIFQEEQIVSTMWRQLSWSHIKEILIAKLHKAIAVGNIQLRIKN
jgi:hypothetical protein